MTDSLTYYTLHRNGTCADGEHEDVFGVGYRTREAAEAAARAFLASLDPAVVLASPGRGLWSCPGCRAGLDAPVQAGCSRCGVTIEYRHRATSATLLPCYTPTAATGFAELRGWCEWRCFRRRRQTSAVTVGGVDYSRTDYETGDCTEWSTDRPDAAGALLSSIAVRIDRHDIRWAP